MNQSEEGWAMLKDLRPGAVFVTRAGIYAVKSEYFYTGDSESQCECVLLASGEYAHFRDGNETLVREVSVETQERMVGQQPTKLSGERDTHFQGFARLLLNDIFDEREGSLILGRDLYPQDNEQVAQHIARRAYDLVYFLLDKAEYHSGSFDVGWGTPDEIHETISHLPDLTEWPIEPT